MNEPSAEFTRAIGAAKQLPEKPDNDTLLKLYALYKQGTAGDVSGDKPGFFDFIAVAKYDAWAGLEGLEPEAAQQQYVDLVRALGGNTE